ncbi:VOC family protein [Propionibacterium sp.]|uniref:VOC family protein n=1 Tax=Propionibacterium sp. TaxID=1977903 RepID=UPI0039E7575A
MPTDPGSRQDAQSSSQSTRPGLHGIDHIGLTVPDIEQATAFLVDALDAEVLYDTLKKSDPPRQGPETAQRLGIPVAMTQRAIRMIRLPNGPGIELFEYEGPDQRGPVVPSDIGWQHIAFYVDDVDAALTKVEAAGGSRTADPRDLAGVESGEGNRFVYVKTPWGSTIELISYPDPQPCLDLRPDPT